MKKNMYIVAVEMASSNVAGIIHITVESKSEKDAGFKAMEIADGGLAFMHVRSTDKNGSLRTEIRSIEKIKNAGVLK